MNEAERKRLAKLRSMAENGSLTEETEKEYEGLLQKEAEGEQKAAVDLSEVKAIDEENKELTVIATSDSVDRMGDIVDQNGLKQSANFKKNSVLLADHDYRVEKVLGKVVEIGKPEQIGTKTVRKMRIKFATDISPLADFTFKMMKEGFINAVSIGFRPLKTEIKKIDNKFVRIFKEWELLELSVVAVPANQDAVRHALQKGVITQKDIDSLEKGFNETKDEDVLKVYRKCFVQIRDLLGIEGDPNEVELIKSTTDALKSLFPKTQEIEEVKEAPAQTTPETSARPAQKADLDDIVRLALAK